MCFIIIVKSCFDFGYVVEVLFQEEGFDLEEFFEDEEVDFGVDEGEGDNVLFEGVVDVLVVMHELFVVLGFSRVDQHAELGLPQHQRLLERHQLLLYLFHQLLA